MAAAKRIPVKIGTPRWAVPLLSPAPYKGAAGGRSCVHPDTLIDTPFGQTKIRDFNGGPVYSYYAGRRVVALATPAYEGPKEDLYTVTLADGSEITVTGGHRFLTRSGWRRLRDLSTSSEVCTLLPATGVRPLDSIAGVSLFSWLLNGRHSIQTLADFQAGCLLYPRRCGQQPQWAVSSGLERPPLPVDAQPHSSLELFREGGQEFSGIDTLSLSFRRGAIEGLLEGTADRYCVKGENYSAGRFFEPLFAICRDSLLSLCCTAPVLLDRIWRALARGFYFLTCRGGNLETLFRMLRRTLCGGSLCDPYSSLDNVNVDFHYTKIRRITKQTPLNYWDMHVYGTNNYLSNGIVNHNSGKSHFFAEKLVEEHLADADLCSVCIREVQKSLKYSAKKLIESKIETLGVGHLFEITQTEIRRQQGNGVIIFQGMQDHTAESIKSLEGFKIAWVEEAQSLSARSLELLIPTIRAENSQIWFSWNPDQPTDPVDQFFADRSADKIQVHVNFTDNPFCPQKSKDTAAAHLKRDPDTYAHVWLGAYNSKADDQVLSGKWQVDEFTPAADWDGPYLGADWGFASDPNALIECYIHKNTLYVYREQYGLGVEIENTPAFFAAIPNARSHIVRADSARPELISYMKRHGYPLIRAVEKWPGSVEDGISKLRSFDKIVIHTDCKETQTEARLWKYKRDRLSGDVLPQLIDAHNHCWDSIRYAIAPLIKTDSFADALRLATRTR